MSPFLILVYYIVSISQLQTNIDPARIYRRVVRPQTVVVTTVT